MYAPCHGAAIARSHQLVLVTNNVRDFRRFEKLEVVDWTKRTSVGGSGSASFAGLQLPARFFARPVGLRERGAVLGAELPALGRAALDAEALTAVEALGRGAAGGEQE